MTFEPVKTKLTSAGARELFSSREIPGEVVDVLVVHAETLRLERRRLREIMEGWFRALKYMQHEPLAAARLTARRLKITPQEVIKSFDGMESPDALQNVQLLNQDLPKTLERLQDTLVGSGLLRERQDTRGLLDSGLLPR